MPPDFKAVLSDLTSMSKTFHDERQPTTGTCTTRSPRPSSAAVTAASTTPSRRSPTSSSPCTPASRNGWTTTETR